MFTNLLVIAFMLYFEEKLNAVSLILALTLVFIGFVVRSGLYPAGVSAIKSDFTKL